VSSPLKFLHFEVETGPDGSPRVLGRGAMGITYKAFDTNLRAPVALKVITPTLLADPVARDRFLREARTAAALRHRNVATILFLGEAGGEVFYAMEFVEGRSVQEEIKASGTISAPRALAICSGVARALAAAHRAGLIHRDIKPANIMVTDRDNEPEVKLIDFGLAKLETGEFTGQTLAEASAAGFQGTPHYASPEQINGEVADIRSDIYSLGVTLFAMLTGRAPFEGSLAQVLSKHLSMPPPLEILPLSALPLRPVLARMLEKDPAARFQTPAELRAALEAASAETSGLEAHDTVGDGGPPDTSPGATFAGKYKLDGRFASLSHATIYRAERLAGGPPAGLIFAAETGWQDAAGVAQAVEKLRAIPSECLITVAGIERTESSAALVTEWIEGPTLYDVLKRRSQVPTAEAIAVLTRVARGLDSIEQAGVNPPRLTPGDIVFSGPEALDRPLDEIPGLRAAFLPIRPASPQDSRSEETLLPAPLEPKRTSAARSLAPVACEIFGGLPVDGSGRWTPLPSLSAYGNASMKAVFEGRSEFSSASELVDALRPGAKAPRRRPRPQKPPVGEGGPAAREATARPMPAPGPRRPPTRRKSPWPVLVAFAVLLGLGSLAVYFYLGRTTPAPPAETPETPPAPEAVASPTAPPTPDPTPDPSLELMEQAEALKRRDDIAGALDTYARACDAAHDPQPAREQMEMLSALARSDAFRMDAEKFGALRAALERAAERDVISAQMLLGEQLRESEPSGALRWFTAAATNGQTEAMTQAGLMLANGVGGEGPDFYAAVGWFKQGAAGGDTDAMVSLADALLAGKGTAPNAIEALELLRVAAAFNHPAALVMLGDLTRHGIPGTMEPDLDEAFRLFDLAAEMGSLTGQANLGVMYVNGWGTEKNPAKALALWKEGAEGGDAISMYFYAVALEGGLVGSTDPSAARDWYVQSARKGNAKALEWCRRNNVPVDAANP
jgi:serine/threonine protein kinase/TPR repeat protein